MVKRDTHPLKKQVDQSFKWEPNVRRKLCLIRNGYRYVVYENKTIQRLRLRCAHRINKNK